MSTIIIYAHPNTRSLNYAILENVIKGLNDANQKFEVVDLYEEKFDPVLVIDDQHKRRDMINAPYTEKYRKQIQQDDI